MGNEDILHVVYRHFEYLHQAPDMKSKRKKFKGFINYSVKNYLASSAKYPFKLWNYFDSVTEDLDMAVTTNSLENINLKPKMHLGHGYLSAKMLTESLRVFRKSRFRYIHRVYVITK